MSRIDSKGVLTSFDKKKNGDSTGKKQTLKPVDESSKERGCGMSEYPTTRENRRLAPKKNCPVFRAVAYPPAW
jgi:hypothetical protein